MKTPLQKYCTGSKKRGQTILWVFFVGGGESSFKVSFICDHFAKQGVLYSVWESATVIMPYFKSDCSYCLLNAAFFFLLEVVGSFSVSQIQPFFFGPDFGLTFLLPYHMNITNLPRVKRHRRMIQIFFSCHLQAIRWNSRILWVNMSTSWTDLSTLS